MVEYAWRQPDGVIAPVLQTEGYTLMFRGARGDAVGDWLEIGYAHRVPYPAEIGTLLSSNDPELPVGSVVVDCHGELWYRPTLEADEDPRRCWVSRDDAQSWTKVAGNYGPVRVIALPQA